MPTSPIRSATLLILHCRIALSSASGRTLGGTPPSEAFATPRRGTPPSEAFATPRRGTPPSEAFAPIRYALPLAVSLLAVLLTGCTRPAETPAPKVNANAPAASGGNITAVQFSDVADAAGLNYVWKAPGKSPHNILQTIGNGCAFLDYDGDGNLDILLIGPKIALYRGDGKGHFTDVSKETGVDKLSGHFLGCAVGDYDNDGFPDVYISAYQGGVLLHNESGKRFTDATKSAGITAMPWGTSCAFADLDGDGKLDLYICNYVIFTDKTTPQMCPEKGVIAACGPRFYTADKSAVYRNLGGGKFKNRSAEWNLKAAHGPGLGVAAADFDGSGHQSLAVANDEAPGDLLRLTGGKLQNSGATSGVAYDSAGQVHGGMGIDWGDYDNDGKLDLLVATYEHEPKSLYHNEGNGFFNDAAGPAGLTDKTRDYIAFGAKFFDADNDGWLDIVLANGHIEDNVAQVNPGSSYAQPTQLFHNNKGASFEEISAQSGPGFSRKIVGRGIAVGDFDNDGRLDLLVVDSEGKPLLLHNDTKNAARWLGLKLIGAKSNRDGYGAIITVKAGNLNLMRRCQSDGSYLSASDPRIHFGLGDSPKADALTVRWPDGHTDTFANLSADRYLTLREGDAAPR